MEYSVAKAAEDVYNAFRQGDIKFLRKTSNACAESMATEGEEGMLSLSAISYVLGKIMEKPRYFRDKKLEELTSFVENKLRECAEQAKAGDREVFRQTCSEITKYLEEFDEKNKRYARGLFEKAHVKIAARLYAQGFSLSYVVSITGADTQEVLKYIGQTLMFDRVGKTKGVEERLSHARRIFK